MSNYYHSTHMVIDIETLGIKPGCVILSIAAKVFMIDDSDNIKYLDSYYDEYSLKSSTEHGFSVDHNTLKWWINDDDTREEFYRLLESHKDINVGLAQFSQWFNLSMEEFQIKYIWGNSPDFDIDIIQYSLSMLNLPELKMKFWQRKDVRTLVGSDGILSKSTIEDIEEKLELMNPLDYEDPSWKPHNAEFDVTLESYKLAEAFKFINNSRSLQEGTVQENK